MKAADPFQAILAEMSPPKNQSRRATHRARAPGPPPENDENIDLRLSFYGTNDFDNGRRLYERFGSDIMFVDRIGWHAWDGARWVGGDDGASFARKMAQQIGALIKEEAKVLEMAIAANPRIASDERVNMLLSWANTSGNSARITSMLNEAKEFVRKKVGDLDRHENLLPCLNGCLVLGKKTIFRENRREDFMTRCVPVNYTPHAAAPTFRSFLELIQPIEEDRDFMQRIFGYTATGHTREDKFFMLYGLGRNGKTTLAQAIRHVLGDFSAGIPIAALMRPNGLEKSGSEASPEIARLPGVRMVTADEPREGAKLDEGKVKKLTGGDSVETRALFKDIFEFKPSFKIFMLANYKPSIYGVDEGIWRRLLVVPFKVKVPDDKVDRDLDKKIKAEASGILNWIVEGVEAWFHQGLNPPASSTAANAEYRADENPVGHFIEACCDPLVRPGSEYKANPETGKPYSETFKALREAYEGWSRNEGFEPLSPKAFASKLSAMGYEKRPSNGHVIYLDVWLRARDVSKAATNDKVST